MAKDKNPNLALRIQVESGGCHGFQYLMSLITIPSTDATDTSSSTSSVSSSSSPLINEDDSIFEYVSDDADAASSSSKASPRIILDEASLDLLKGSKVDFTMELIGSQFKIVDNPFDIKM
ncbi:Iron-sulfur cluster assembly 2 -like protein [Escovopsis weberi]|uniref:Iron-sulfur cluster assembly 2-like protein n=1 Tax=Escovopsis weberi TaxID=150374 RepID=A0A0M8MZA5_ESCWE|nr:Iron-sulfur cluster assembly 2 -like protein [Escovopsis weberi]